MKIKNYRAIAVKGSNKKLKIIKEESKMKKRILTIVLIVTVLFIFSTVSHAQNHKNFGLSGAMANLAEQERIAKEQNATAKRNENVTTENKVAYAEKAYLNVAEETDQVEN
jgi:predicted negative regulator of RcsB-dependent stress response